MTATEGKGEGRKAKSEREYASIPMLRASGVRGWTNWRVFLEMYDAYDASFRVLSTKFGTRMKQMRIPGGKGETGKDKRRKKRVGTRMGTNRTKSDFDGKP
jgi:hypothetical protein